MALLKGSEPTNSVHQTGNNACTASGAAEGGDTSSVTIPVLSAGQIYGCETDPVHSMYLGESNQWKCTTVKESSTVYLAAVKSAIDSTFPPHFGVCVENRFLVTNPRDETNEFSFLVAHMFLVRKELWRTSPQIVVQFCNSRERVFKELQLQGVFDVYEEATRSLSPGCACSTACSGLVKEVKKELSRPFDKHWRTQMERKADQGVGNATNCGLFAARVYRGLVTLEHNEDVAAKGVREVLKEINNLELMDGFWQYVHKKP